MDTNSARESKLAAGIGGAFLAVLALLALALASQATDGGFALFATLLFGFCVLMIFGLIRRHVGVATKPEAAATPSVARRSAA